MAANNVLKSGKSINFWYNLSIYLNILETVHDYTVLHGLSDYFINTLYYVNHLVDIDQYDICDEMVILFINAFNVLTDLYCIINLFYNIFVCSN